MKLHPDLRKILSRIGMKNEPCCPFCCQPKTFTDITITQTYYTTQCSHGCDIYVGRVHSNEFLQQFSFTVNPFQVEANFESKNMRVYMPDGERSISELPFVMMPLDLSMFDTEQKMMRKLKLYMTFS